MIITIDGIDNTGKTSLIDRVSKKVKCTRLAFPSQSLCSSKAFSDLVTMKGTPDYETVKKNWLDALINEQKQALAEATHASQPILIDRFWFSSLIYQGDWSAPSSNKYINEAYEKMLQSIGIKPEHLQHIFLTYPMGVKTEETNETKKHYDKQKSQLFLNAEIVTRATNTYLYSDYLKDTFVFREWKLHDLHYNGILVTEKDLDYIQEHRTGYVLNQLLN
ncbi:MAG: hypothetical protein WC444_04120 [Candidatus Paceibacterota bacterium]